MPALQLLVQCVTEPGRFCSGWDEIWLRWQCGNQVDLSGSNADQDPLLADFEQEHFFFVTNSNPADDFDEIAVACSNRQIAAGKPGNAENDAQNEQQAQTDLQQSGQWRGGNGWQGVNALR